MLEIVTKIKELRKSKKLTQKALADVLNVTPQAVSKWERNQNAPDIETLIKLSHYFNISIDEILGNKRPSFFDSLFSRMKGRASMNKEAHSRTESLAQKDHTKKTVMIFDSVFSFSNTNGLLQTQILATKMEKSVKKKNPTITIESYSSNQVDKMAKQASFIILTPTFGFAKEEIMQKFPGIPVIVISKKDYGLLNTENIVSDIVKVLNGA